MGVDNTTEFEDLDPQEIHLVPKGASGFPILLAKAVGDSIDEVRDESQLRSHNQSKPKGKKMKKTELRAALARAEAELAGSGRVNPPATRTDTRPPSAESAVSTMKAAANDAERLGEVAKADGLRRDVAVLKMQIGERLREERRQPSRLGPGSVELFTRTGRLGEDTAIGGV